MSNCKVQWFFKEVPLKFCGFDDKCQFQVQNNLTKWHNMISIYWNLPMVSSRAKVGCWDEEPEPKSLQTSREAMLYDKNGQIFCNNMERAPQQSWE